MQKYTGIVRLVSGALLAGTNLWLTSGIFEPVARDGRGIEYVLVSTSFVWLAGCIALSAAALLLLQAIVLRRQPPGSRSSFLASDNTRHLRALGWTALSLVPLLNLVGPLAGALPPVTYALWELRWLWWTLVLLVMLCRVDAALAALHAISNRWQVTALVVIPVAWVIAFTPQLRFSGVLHGDEPKYIRYCENFYQGLGFDIANKRSLVELAGNDQPHVAQNIRLLLGAIPEETASLVADVRRILGFPAPPRLLAQEPTPAMVFAGKRPGTFYQLHNPGLSFLLFPGYYLDRRVTGGGLGYRDEFPADMPAVHVTLLALYVGYGLALYGLLRAYTPIRTHAWALALVGVLALPASAFAFQIYPEMAAGIAMFLLVRMLIAPASPGPIVGLAYGMLAAFLPWLHVRLGLASAVMLAWMLTQRAHHWRSRASFAFGILAGLGALSLYTYHLTGSLLPTSTYGEGVPLSVSRLLKGIPAFAFDRVWGLLPHSPVYLLALPGIGLAWRRRPALAAWLLALTGAVVIPAAGHGFWAGGSTPGRYLVTIAPLLLLFAADAMAAWSSRRVFVAAFAALTLVSLETSVAYDLHHRKDVGPLVTHDFSGWRFNLLFPSLGTETWTATAIDVTLLAAWIALALALMLLARRRTHQLGGDATGAAPEGMLRDSFAALMVVSVMGTGVGLATQQTIDKTYLMPAKEARERALSAYGNLSRCALCYSSADGMVPPTESLGNAVGSVRFQVNPPSPRPGERVRILVRPRSPDGEFVLATIRLDLGDGTVKTYPRFFGDLDERQTYHRAGEYRIHAWVTASSERPAEAELVLGVSPQP